MIQQSGNMVDHGLPWSIIVSLITMADHAILTMVNDGIWWITIVVYGRPSNTKNFAWGASLLSFSGQYTGTQFGLVVCHGYITGPGICKLCWVFLFQGKVSPGIYSIISKKQAPLCSPSSLSWNKPYFSSVTPLLTKLPFLTTVCQLFPNWCTLLAVCVNWRINHIAKWANSANNGLREMKIDSFNGGYNSHHNGAGIGEISKIDVMQRTCCIGRGKCERVQ